MFILNAYRGRHIHVQLSNHKELKATSKDDANGGGHGSNGVVDHIAPPKVDDIDQNDDRIGGFNAVKNDPSPVIRVVIENMIYQVTIDTLYAVFSRCGVVQKIILFTKNNSFQALVQFADISSAIKARQVMNGQTMYAGANLLRVDYSKLINLNIKFQNDKSRDFTLMGPPTNVIGAPVMSGGGGGGGGHGNNNGGQYGNGEGGNPDEAMLAQQFGIYGHAALRGANAHPYANVAALQALQSASSLANGGLLSPAPLSIAQMPNAGNVGGVPISRVILVSGLAPEVSVAPPHPCPFVSSPPPRSFRRLGAHRSRHCLSLFICTHPASHFSLSLFLFLYFFILILIFLIFVLFFSIFYFSFATSPTTFSCLLSLLPTLLILSVSVVFTTHTHTNPSYPLHTLSPLYPPRMYIPLSLSLSLKCFTGPCELYTPSTSCKSNHVPLDYYHYYYHYFSLLGHTSLEPTNTAVCLSLKCCPYLAVLSCILPPVFFSSLYLSP